VFFFVFMGLRLAALGGATLRGSLSLGPACGGSGLLPQATAPHRMFVESLRRRNEPNLIWLT
jgi:hypothetical protein